MRSIFTNLERVILCDFQDTADLFHGDVHLLGDLPGNAHRYQAVTAVGADGGVILHRADGDQNGPALFLCQFHFLGISIFHMEASCSHFYYSFLLTIPCHNLAILLSLCYNKKARYSFNISLYKISIEGAI